MKIEKINDNQIRCILSKEDLANRQIKISELAYGSEKAKHLFRDMIEQANYEFGFEAEDMPLMIEAIPMSGENIILQITKVEYPEELDTRFSRFSDGEEDEEEHREPAFFADTKGADDVLGMYKSMKEESAEQRTRENTGEEAPVKVVEKQSAVLTKMFEFRTLEQLERLSRVLGCFYCGENDLYKDTHKNRYYLLVRKSNHTPEEFNKLCNIMAEYGSQKKYSPATEAFFKEHGKLILQGCALKTLEALN